MAKSSVLDSADDCRRMMRGKQALPSKARDVSWMVVVEMAIVMMMIGYSSVVSCCNGCCSAQWRTKALFPFCFARKSCLYHWIVSDNHSPSAAEPTVFTHNNGNHWYSWCVQCYLPPPYLTGNGRRRRMNEWGEVKWKRGREQIEEKGEEGVKKRGRTILRWRKNPTGTAIECCCCCHCCCWVLHQKVGVLRGCANTEERERERDTMSSRCCWSAREPECGTVCDRSGRRRLMRRSEKERERIGGKGEREKERMTYRSWALLVEVLALCVFVLATRCWPVTQTERAAKRDEGKIKRAGEKCERARERQKNQASAGSDGGGGGGGGRPGSNRNSSSS